MSRLQTVGRFLTISSFALWGSLVCAHEPETAAALMELPAVYEARDTLQSEAVSATADQLDCLAGLCWKPDSFAVTVDAPFSPTADYLVQFPSPRDSPWPVNNRVALEWYAARTDSGELARKPAIVVVHESGRGMTMGRLFARSFHKQGYHAFLLHLPGYGARSWGKKPEAQELMILLQQAITDVRRARDAVASLPGVDATSISLQGTSLGGIVSSTVAGLDHSYTAIFLLLAGGDLHGLIAEGQKDAAKLREQLQRAGATDEQIREFSSQIEPLRLASRMPTDRVWLYSGKYDTVVPMKNANLLAQTAGLSPAHHVIMPANHYTGIFYLPMVLKHINENIQKLTVEPVSVEPVIE